jgi:hypothetical protein
MLARRVELMISMIRTTASFLGLASLTACTAQVGVHEAIDLPRDAAATCEQQCDDIGLVFDGVAIVGNSVACLCAPRGALDARSGKKRRAGAAHVLVAEDQGDNGPTLR